MKYDVTDPRCGETYIETRLGDDHERGDRVTIKCRKCGRVTEHLVRSRLTGLKKWEDAQ